MSNDRNRIRGEVGFAALDAATDPGGRGDRLANAEGIWSPVDLFALRTGETIRVTFEKDSVAKGIPLRVTGEVVSVGSDTTTPVTVDVHESGQDMVIEKEPRGTATATNSNGEMVGNIEKVEVLSAGEEHARGNVHAANRFFPDGYAVWDWESRGFVRSGMMGKQVFETYEEANRVAGEQQLVVRLARPDARPNGGETSAATVGDDAFPPGPEHPPEPTTGQKEREPINDREFNIVVPKTDNAGNDIKPELLADVAHRMADRFGGVTVTPSVAGCWSPDDSDELMCEENIILSSGRDSSDGVWYATDEKWMEELAQEVADDFGQASVMVSESVTEVDFIGGDYEEELPPSKIGRDLFADLL